jgi:hypothetical protein
LPTKKTIRRRRRKATRRTTLLQILSGKWKIIEMPDFTDDYLRESKEPHIELTFREDHVDGRYEFGLNSGELDGEVIRGEGRPLEIRFSFEGVDEMDTVHGYGEAVISDDNETLTGKLHYHAGDDYRFTCKRT